MASEKRFDTTYAQYYDYFNQGKEYTKEVDFLETVFKKYNVQNKSILDIGCGTGLHMAELIKRGYQLTGLDLSPEMIELAKKRNSQAEFHIADMSNFSLYKKYDVIICMFSALGYLTKNEQLESFFQSCKNHLNKDGLLILDVWNGLGVMQELPTRREKIAELTKENLKIIRTSYPTLDVKNHVNHVKFVVKIFEISSGRLITEYEENHTVRFFFPLELKKYLTDAGFELLHLCPSFNFDEELTEKQWNMVLVARLK